MKDVEKLLAEARKRLRTAVEAESAMREDMLADQRFEAGEQWDERVKNERVNDPEGARPCLVLNRARKHRNAIINDMRQSRPQIRVLPVDDRADPETAEMINGLLRHIQVSSDGDLAYDSAAESAVTVGVGYFRVLTRTVHRASSLQEVALGPVRNPFAVYMDPAAEDPSGMDARWCFVIEDMPRDEFEETYPGAEAVDWGGVRERGLEDWYPDQDTVRVAEYWCAKEVETPVVDTELGVYTEAEYTARFAGSLAPPRITARRQEMIREVRWHKLSGVEVLDEALFPSRYIGIVRVMGEERLVDGKIDRRGIVRDIRDPQRLYNYWASLNAEHIALAPKAPYVGPIDAFEGHEDEWASANRSNHAYLPYNHLDEQGNPIPPPQRQNPVPGHSGLISGMQMAAEDIREISGQNQSSFGEPGNEKSGRAIVARQREAESNNFHFIDNLQRAVRHAGRIMLDLIPRVYDTERVLRVLGEDNDPQFAELAQTGRAYTEMQDVRGKVRRLYDLSVGQYDVVVSVGASYATRRMEALDQMTAIVQAQPQVFAVIGDMMVRAMDWPGADDMAERLKALLPPEVRQIEDARSEGRNSAQAQMAAMQQSIMAQVQPIIEELQQALQAAGMEVDEKDEKITELSLQLRDKMGELQLKAEEIDQRGREADMKHKADMAKVRADLMQDAMQQETTLLQARQAQPEGEAPRTDDQSGQHVAAVMATQQTLAAMQQMADALSAQIAGIAEAQAQTQAQVEGVTAQMARDAERRSVVAEQVERYLRTGDDSALSAALATADN